MSDKIILRVHSKAGRSRVEISGQATLHELKTELSSRLSIPSAQIKLFTDQGLKKPLVGRDTASLVAMKLKNGDMLHVGNQETKLASVTAAKAAAEAKAEADKAEAAKKEAEKKKAEEEASAAAGTSMIDTTGKAKGAAEENKSQPANQAKDGMVSDAKHEAFDEYIAAMLKKCARSHSSNQKCPNCTFSRDVRYTVDYNCKYHPPYPRGSCHRCIPRSVVLNRQKYRHVDYVSFMNFQELQKFVDHWRRGSCMEQRTAHLYGYFSEDPNYPHGVRVNIEAIYDPPQISEINGFIEMDDPADHKVQMIAGALGLERVGTIFTKVDQDTILTAEEVKTAARSQELYSFDHNIGLKVPKFVTVVVGLKGDDDVEVNCYMVSDQCQALVSANVFGNSDDRKKLVVRTPEPNEMVPAFLQEGSSVTEVAPEFFIVNVAHGQPGHGRDYNVLKIYDFPVKNRSHNPATPADFTGYLKKYKSDPTEKVFANFQLLCFLAEMMDIDTALTCAQCVAIEAPLDPALMELFRSM